MHLSALPLLDQDTLQYRVREMAKTISSDYAERVPILIGVLKGALHFTSDLSRALTIPIEMDFIRAASYAGTESTGNVSIGMDGSLALDGRDVILVEDILDTGRTATTIIAHLETLSPASIKLCTLLDKPSRRVIPVTADYTGFSIDDHFVVGYGLDFDERYRELPSIHVLEP